jgi:hypothetical protein
MLELPGWHHTSRSYYFYQQPHQLMWSIFSPSTFSLSDKFTSLLGWLQRSSTTRSPVITLLRCYTVMLYYIQMSIRRKDRVVIIGPKQCKPQHSSIDGWGVAKSSHDDSATHDHPSYKHVIHSINQHIITSSYSLQILIIQFTVISHLDFSQFQ